MWLLILLTWATGVLVSLGMITAQFGGERLLALHPKVVYALFVAFWPVSWLLGLGAVLMVKVALISIELERRGAPR